MRDPRDKNAERMDKIILGIGFGLLGLAGIIMILMLILIVEIFVSPQDITLISLVLDSFRDSDAAIYGTLGGEVLTIKLSESVLYMLTLVLSAVLFLFLASVFRALVGSGVDAILEVSRVTEKRKKKVRPPRF